MGKKKAKWKNNAVGKNRKREKPIKIKKSMGKKEKKMQKEKHLNGQREKKKMKKISKKSDFA